MFFPTYRVLLTLFIYFWLHWVFTAACGLSLAVASGGCSQVAGRSLLTAVAFLVDLCGAQASVVVAHGLSCPMAYGIFLDRGLNPCLLIWQVDSYPLDHKGSPTHSFYM